MESQQAIPTETSNMSFFPEKYLDAYPESDQGWGDQGWDDQGWGDQGWGAQALSYPAEESEVKMRKTISSEAQHFRNSTSTRQQFNKSAAQEKRLIEKWNENEMKKEKKNSASGLPRPSDDEYLLRYTGAADDEYLLTCGDTYCHIVVFLDNLHRFC